MIATMTATLQKLDNEPILIVTHEGYLSLKDTEEVTARVIQAMDAAETPLYGIIDLRSATSDFSEFMRILVYQSTGARGTLANRESYVVLVGTNVLIRLFHNLMRERKLGGVTVSVYYNMDEALRAVRLRIEADAQQAG
ncbi:MAG: hypothetical protein ABI700_16420 [Chloroflexota bacterium]